LIGIRHITQILTIIGIILTSLMDMAGTITVTAITGAGTVMVTAGIIHIILRTIMSIAVTIIIIPAITAVEQAAKDTQVQAQPAEVQPLPQAEIQQPTEAQHILPAEAQPQQHLRVQHARRKQQLLHKAQELPLPEQVQQQFQATEQAHPQLPQTAVQVAPPAAVMAHQAELEHQAELTAVRAAAHAHRLVQHQAAHARQVQRQVLHQEAVPAVPLMINQAVLVLLQAVHVLLQAAVRVLLRLVRLQAEVQVMVHHPHRLRLRAAVAAVMAAVPEVLAAAVQVLAAVAEEDNL
jgi:hypothetical protein